MQDEINEKVIALSIRTTKLTVSAAPTCPEKAELN